MVGCVLICFNCCLGFACWSLVAGLAWIVVRPMMGVWVLIASVGAGLIVWYLSRHKDQLRGQDGAKKLDESDADLSISVGIADANGSFHSLSRDVNKRDFNKLGESGHDLRKRLSSPVYVSSENDLRAYIHNEEEVDLESDSAVIPPPLPPRRSHAVFPVISRSGALSGPEPAPAAPPRHTHVASGDTTAELAPLARPPRIPDAAVTYDPPWAAGPVEAPVRRGDGGHVPPLLQHGWSLYRC